MEPQEKALELFDKYYKILTSEHDLESANESNNYKQQSKESALICVEQLLKYCDSNTTFRSVPFANYWRKVEQELKNI